MKVKIMGFVGEESKHKYTVSVEKGQAVVVPVEGTEESARAIQDDLNRNGILGRGKNGKLMPKDDGFLDEMHFEFKSAYMCAMKPE